jgi:HK97 family phage portal protein
MNGFQYDCFPGAGVAEVATFQNRMSEDWFFEHAGWGKSDSGEAVNPSTAVRHGPVWQAVNVIAGDIGQLPMVVMRQAGRTKERDENHPADWLLNYMPNDWQTPSMWKEFMISSALLWGNGISLIVRRGGRPMEMIPLRPDRLYYQEIPGGYMVSYTNHEGKVTWLNPDDLFHIRGLSSDGFWGLSAVQVAKNTIGHGLALQRHGNSTFKNGARPSGTINFPQGVKLSTEARSNFRGEWNSLHQGAANTGNVALLWDGATFSPMTMSNDDAQWLEAIKMDVIQTAGLFSLPPFKLGSMENSSVRANIEEQQRDYIYMTLGRHGNRFKEEAERKLFTTAELKGPLYIRINYDPLLQGNRQSKMETITLGVRSRLLTRNEAREELGYNPVEDGDDFENPAIDTKAAAEPADTKEEDTEQDAQAGTKDLIEKQVESLLRTEANRLTCAAGKSHNFLAWADQFYADYEKFAADFLSPACALAVILGMGCDWKSAARDHAAANLKSVLLMTDTVKAEQLGDGAERLAETIRGQVNAFTHDILRGNHG